MLVVLPCVDVQSESSPSGSERGRVGIGSGHRGVLDEGAGAAKVSKLSALRSRMVLIRCAVVHDGV